MPFGGLGSIGGFGMKKLGAPKMPKIGGKIGGGGGLGSLGARHTMPHLMNRAQHYQTGGQALAQMAVTPNTNPLSASDQYKQFLQAASQPSLSAMKFQGPQFVQEGGEIEESAGEVQSPSDQMSPEEGQHKEIVQAALAALDGAHPDPQKAIQEFIQTFGERALADLQQLHQERTEDEQSGEDEEQASGTPGDLTQMLGSAGGGLLKGRGTGQSDEIEGETPSGRPVLLSDGEYVIDAPTVSALGDGSTEAGARRLDDLRKQIRQDAWGHNKQAKPMSKGGKPRIFNIK